MRRLLLGCACTLLAGCAATATPVQAPPPDADPEEVVAVLVEAINARDADVLPFLATPIEAGNIEATWFGTRFTELEVDPAAPIPVPAGAPFQVYVHVDAVLENTDGSLPEGELVGWGYTLVQQDDGRWLVTEQGVG